MNELSKNLVKNFLFLILIFLILGFGFHHLKKSLTLKGEILISQLAKEINQGKIAKITVKGNDLLIFYKDGREAKSRKEEGLGLVENLIQFGVEKEKIKDLSIKIEKKEEGSFWLTAFIFGILPLVFFGLFFWILLKRAKGGGGEIFRFLQAPIKSYKEKLQEKVTFKDVANLEEAKRELKEVVEFLKNPKKFLKVGARVPRGVLLIGPPGCGKTLLARAVANESNVPFYSIVGSEFVELFVGVGAARIRSLFETAKKNQPAIIFIDEIDAIGKIRMPGVGGSHEEREQTLNQLLAEMDGFAKETGIIVLAATNKPEILDPALLRPGRFDRRIVVDLPDVKGREEILKIHCRGKPLAKNVDLKEIAERTPGFSGADLANLVNEAAILAATKDQEIIYQKELLESIEKVLLGPERKSHLLTKEEKEIAAYHESGHALLSAFLPYGKIVRKISIISRGVAAGYTLAEPKEERKIKTKSQLLTEITILLGGYVAEKLKFKEISTGGANDIEQATELARKLVKEYGMSRLGPLSFGKREKAEFLGIESEKRNYSEKIALAIDKEVERIVKEAEEKALKTLKENKKLLDKLAKLLIKKETIERKEFENLLKSAKIKRKKRARSSGVRAPSL